MFAADVYDFKAMPTRVKRSHWDDLSAVERRFPRIARELSLRWKDGDIDGYLDGLLIDERGNRQGFPGSVLEELMFLSSLRWQLIHPSFDRADQGLVEQFSFSPATHLDPKFCAPTPGWVLA